MSQVIIPGFTGSWDEFEQKLSSPDAAIWQRRFIRFMGRKNPWPDYPPPYCSLKLGDLSKDEFFVRVRNSSKFVDPMAKEMIRHADFKMATEEMEIDVVVVTPRQLGFPFPDDTRPRSKFASGRGLGYPQLGEIKEKGVSEFDLAIASPDEIALQLFLEWVPKKRGEVVTVAMEGTRLLTLVCNSGWGKFLREKSNDPQAMYGIDELFAFVRPREVAMER